jgi:hypothetical protein
VRSWSGKVMVDVREFYVKDGKDLPGRKGIAVTLSSSLTPIIGLNCQMGVACCAVWRQRGLHFLSALLRYMIV